MDRQELSNAHVVHDLLASGVFNILNHSTQLVLDPTLLDLPRSDLFPSTRPKSSGRYRFAYDGLAFLPSMFDGAPRSNQKGNS